MAVMNGFRKELLDKILGFNGHCSFSRWKNRHRLGRSGGACGRCQRHPARRTIVEGQALGLTAVLRR